VSIRQSLSAALIAVAWLGGCSEEPTEPTAATLQVRLATPAQDDGAVLFTLSGGPIDSVDAPGHVLYLGRPDDNTIRVIVAGELASGAIAQVHIPDDRQVSQYSATLQQVASRGYAQRDITSYGLTLER
jgi:hypothetical protein